MSPRGNAIRNKLTGSQLYYNLKAKNCFLASFGSNSPWKSSNLNWIVGQYFPLFRRGKNNLGVDKTTFGL